MAELKPCPFCGGSWTLLVRHGIGHRMIEGYAECSGCGARVGVGLIALDDDDLKPRIAAMVNARYERTCRNIARDKTNFVCSECDFSASGYAIDDFDNSVPFGIAVSICPNCGAKVVEG